MDNIWICPNCGSGMKRISYNPFICHECPKCGCTIEGREQKFDYENNCPNCHQSMENHSECPYCGYDMGSDFD